MIGPSDAAASPNPTRTAINDRPTRTARLPGFRRDQNGPIEAEKPPVGPAAAIGLRSRRVLSDKPGGGPSDRAAR